MEDILISFIEYVKQFSYAGIIIALTFEFVPAELVLPLVGYWVYEGDMNFYLAVLAGAVGGTTGPLTLYALGYYGGRPLIEKYGKYMFVKDKQLQEADRFFMKYGAAVAFLGRFMPGVRTVISVPCGMAKMNIWLFSLYTFLAMLPVTAGYVYFGFLLGEHWEEAGGMMKQYLLPVSIVIITGILLFVWYKKRHKNR